MRKVMKAHLEYTLITSLGRCLIIAISGLITLLLVVDLACGGSGYSQCRGDLFLVLLVIVVITGVLAVIGWLFGTADGLAALESLDRTRDEARQYGQGRRK